MTEEVQVQSILNVKQEEENLSLLNEETSPIPLTTVTSLPSGFKGYPKGTTIGYKPLTLGELESINSSEMNVNRAIAMLLKAIHCNTLPSEELYYWDVMYIGIQRKLLAFGDTKGTILERCSKCGNILQHQFNYTDLEFRELQAPDLPMQLKVCNKDLKFGLLTMKDFLQVEVEQGELGVYARMIKNLPFEEAYELVSNAFGADIKKLRFVDKQLNYGLKPFIVKCDNKVNGKICNNEVRMEVKSPFEVVFPEDELDRDSEFEVRYGEV